MKNVRKYTSLIAVSIILIASFALMIAGTAADGTKEQYRDNSLADPGGTVFDDAWIPVSSPQELAWVGDNKVHKASNGTSYTWSPSGRYYLVRDITFDQNDPGHDTNGGLDISASATASGTGLHLTLTPPPGAAVTHLSVWRGVSNDTSSGNTIQLTDVPQGTHTLIISGKVKVDSAIHNFTHSVIMDTTISTPNDFKFNSNGNFSPIGISEPFTGKFNGNGRVISGMNVAVFGDVESDAYAGLFGYVSNAEISGLSIVHSRITASLSSDYELLYAGGVVGYAKSSTVAGCHSSALITASSSSYETLYAGGVVGYAESSPIIKCCNFGNVTSSSYSSETGGIAGYAKSSPMTDCRNAGNVTASAVSGLHAGGIVGYAESSLSSITNCYNTGSVTVSSSSLSGMSYAGGIAGYTSSSIADCYNTGPVTLLSSSSYAGGIVGNLSKGTVINCYNTGSVTSFSSSSYAGGIVGYTRSTSKVLNCHYLEGTIGRLCGSGSPTVDGSPNEPARKTDPNQSSGVKTGDQMRPSLADAQAEGGGNSIYYTGTTTAGSAPIKGWDFGSIWTIVPGVNNGYPVLASFSGMKFQFTEQPKDMMTAASGSVTFSALAEAPMLPYYQWYISADNGTTWEMIKGAHGTSYTLGPITKNDDGKKFRVSATAPDHENTTAFSNAATLHVGPYTVSLGSGEGYTLHPQRGSSSTVDSGGSFAFRLSVNEGYTFDQYKVLVNNTELTSDENGIYTINNITEDKKVTVQGTPVPKAYSVTLTQGTGYTLHPYGGSSSPVDSGGSFTFQFSVKEGYTAGPYKVFVNNTEVTSDENGIYTINNITENKTVTVQGTIVVRIYDVTLTSGNGYTLKGYGDSSSPVERGGSFTFQLTVDKGYTAVSYKVFVNTIEVPLDADGRYTIGDITTAQTVYAEGTFELSRYDVTLTSGNGYTLSAHEGSSSPADHGGSFTFQFSVKEGYTAEMYRVLVNSAEVKLDENGRYTIGDITTAQTVIVNGEFKLTSGTGGGAIGGTEEGIDPEFTLLVTVIVPATIAIMAALLLLRGKKQDGDHEQYQ